MKNEGIDTSIDTDENAVDTLDSINEKFERNTSNEIPKNNSWVNYEDEHDVEEIFYTPSENNSDLNFKGFNVKEVADIKQYTDKFIKYNMLQNVEDKEEIEVITIDSDLELDLDFDLDFSGFNSNEVRKIKDYNDKFMNMLKKSKNSEKEEYLDLSFEEDIDNFGDLEESDDNKAEVEEEMEENQAEENSAEDMDSENSEEEDLEGINWSSPDFNVDNRWKNTFSLWKQSGGFQHFRCIRPNCSSFIIVFEDEQDKEAEREFLYEVRECKYHGIQYHSQ